MGSRVVELSSHHPEVEGSSPAAAAATWREKKAEIIPDLAHRGLTEQGRKVIRCRKSKETLFTFFSDTHFIVEKYKYALLH